MELGGNAPFIVFDDADLDAAVDGAMVSKFRNNGQTCVCANRIYVQAGVYDAFAAKLSAAVAKLNIGDGLTAGVTTGPLINEDAVQKVEEHIADVLAGGGAVVAGGARHALGGTYFQPTVVTGVTRDMKVANEETFGPLAPIFRFETEDEVVATLADLAAVGTSIVTIGQYLRPTSHHLPVAKWWTPEDFDRFKSAGESMGVIWMRSAENAATG
jgi:succinate-semialdehyde dehydrogenase/glutarate-semialdehyde dehydrogenase